MRCELLIIFCVSFLNSLTVERGSNDRILMVSEDECDNTFYGKDEEDDDKDYRYCECPGKKNTFLSQDNDQYRCRNEEYLSRLLHFLKVALFADNNGLLTIHETSLATLFKCFLIQLSFTTKP